MVPILRHFHGNPWSFAVDFRGSSRLPGGDPFHDTPWRSCTGQAGLEPATSGFGDRRSTIRATGLRAPTASWLRGRPLLDLRFLVKGVLPVPPAVLCELQLPLGILAILRGGVI